MKKYSLLQKKVDYEYYLQLRENNVLPLLVTLDDVRFSELNDSMELDDLYYISHLSYNPDEKENLYELNLYKIFGSIKKQEISVSALVSLDEVAFPITDVDPGDMDFNSGGLTLNGMGYKNLDVLTSEIIEKQKTKTK